MKNESLSDMVRRQLVIPVDVDTFKFAVGIFQEAATAKLHGSHIPQSSSPGLQLKNIPVNRGMLAIVRETEHLSEDERQSLMMRVMHFGETLEFASQDHRFSEHLQGNEAGFSVSNELMEAIARAPYVIVEDHIKADMNELAAFIAGRVPT